MQHTKKSQSEGKYPRRVVETKLSKDVKTCTFTITKLRDVTQEISELETGFKGYYRHKINQTKTMSYNMKEEQERAWRIRKKEIQSMYCTKNGYNVIKCIHDDLFRSSICEALFKSKEKNIEFGKPCI